MVLVPAPRPVAIPVVPMLEMLGWEELHVMRVVRFCVLPSLKVPVALNCCWAPITITGLRGVRLMPVSVACVTFRVVEPVTELKVALMLALPLPTAVATSPCMVATEVFEDAQEAKPLMNWVDPSLNMPTAKKVLVVPGATETFAGVMAMEVSVAEVTVRVVDAVKEPSTAVMVVVPGC